MASSQIPKGARRCSPGFYELDGALHINAAELCAVLGVPPTPENLNEVANGALEAALEAGVPYREVGP
jgi:hypothetical protein